ncbi:MAG TPA: hypothetical protein VF808_01110 [Ktedonobacterales bacterium]
MTPYFDPSYPAFPTQQEDALRALFTLSHEPDQILYTHDVEDEEDFDEEEGEYEEDDELDDDEFDDEEDEDWEDEFDEEYDSGEDEEGDHE